MNIEEQNYLDLLSNILNNGNVREDRTGVGTIGLFGTQLRFSIDNNVVPILTTRKMFIKAAIEELLMFISGETNTKRLEEKGVNIWKGNTSKEFLKKKGLDHYEEGMMGPLYGHSWRNFGGKTKLYHGVEEKGIDQLSNALNLIKNDPYSRRITITAHNPLDSDKTVLDSCHNFLQFYVNKDKLSCQFYMRSCDLGLGFPTNILSYSILTKLIARAAGLECGNVIFTGGDCHIYKNHIAQIKEQIQRKPFDFPTMKILKDINTIEDMEQLCYKDFIVENYNSHSKIKMEMAI